VTTRLGHRTISASITGGLFVLSLSAGDVRAAGGGSPRPLAVPVLSLELPARLELEAPRMREFLGEGRGLSGAESFAGLAVDFGTTRGNESARKPAPLQMHVVRKVERLWRASSPAGTVLDGYSVDVGVEVFSPDGKAGCLGLPGQLGSEIGVRVIPALPLVSEEGGRHYLQGAATVELDLSSVRYAGTYSGQITVTLVAR
jgi:hypothetical protein